MNSSVKFSSVKSSFDSISTIAFNSLEEKLSSYNIKDKKIEELGKRLFKSKGDLLVRVNERNAECNYLYFMPEDGHPYLVLVFDKASDDLQNITLSY